MAEGSVEGVANCARSYWALLAKRINLAKELQKKFDDLCAAAEMLFSELDQVDANHRYMQYWRERVKVVENDLKRLKRDFNSRQGMERVCPKCIDNRRIEGPIDSLDEKIKCIKIERSLFESPTVRDSKITYTFYKTVSTLVNKIREKKTPKIGILGPDGAGKTSIMRFLKRSDEITSDFIVIWVTVSTSYSIKKLQDQIQQCLSMKIIENEPEEKVANKIFRALLGKKYLLFLDDVRKKVDLGDLGFPEANIDNNCQVVLTTHSSTVCWDMKTKFDIELKSLLEKEVLDSLMAGVEDFKVRSLGRRLWEMCAGFPLLLKIVGGTMRDKRNSDGFSKFWKDLTVADLTKECTLMVCFNHLEENKKECLMYCAFYSQHHKIKKSRVTNYLRANGVPDNDEETSKNTPGSTIFDKLNKLSWLESVDEDEHLTMHVVVQDVLLKMADDKHWKHIKSYMNKDLSAFPDLPNSSSLVSLLLQGNNRLEEIPESIFRDMSKLQNLDLSHTGIKFLPSTISCLTSLRALFLKDCYFLEILPENLEAVKTLEFLQVSGAWMLHLPHWILKSKSLKILKFGYRTVARWWSAPHHSGLGKKEYELPSGFICDFSQIEVFNVSNFMYNSRLSKESADIVSEGLSKMTRLSSLHFTFRTITNLEHFIMNSSSWNSSVLQKFCVIVSEEIVTEYTDFHEDVKTHKRCLKYIRGKGISNVEKHKNVEFMIPSVVLDVLGRSSLFELEGGDEINVFALSEALEKASNIRHCGIYRCAGLVYVDSDAYTKNIFENLESLILSNLSNFRGFIHPGKYNVSSRCSFANLKKLEVAFCPEVRQLLRSSYLRRNLKNLEELYTRNCQKLERIFECDDPENKPTDRRIPKLKKVTLIHLPKLSSFSCSELWYWDSLEELCIIHCPELRNLPFDDKYAPKLKVIRGSRKWWQGIGCKSSIFTRFIEV